jgi:hypothetical protein
MRTSIGRWALFTIGLALGCDSPAPSATDAGVTDTLTMRVGEVGELQFPLPIMLMQCDEPLLTLEATLDTLLLKATATGHTRCGFWYRPQAWPHRTLDVVVTR